MSDFQSLYPLSGCSRGFAAKKLECVVWNRRETGVLSTDANCQLLATLIGNCLQVHLAALPSPLLPAAEKYQRLKHSRSPEGWW